MPNVSWDELFAINKLTNEVKNKADEIRTKLCELGFQANLNPDSPKDPTAQEIFDKHRKDINPQAEWIPIKYDVPLGEFEVLTLHGEVFIGRRSSDDKLLVNKKDKKCWFYQTRERIFGWRPLPK